MSSLIVDFNMLSDACMFCKANETYLKLFEFQ